MNKKLKKLIKEFKYHLFNINSDPIKQLYYYILQEKNIIVDFKQQKMPKDKLINPNWYLFLVIFLVINAVFAIIGASLINLILMYVVLLINFSFIMYCFGYKPIVKNGKKKTDP